jgi:ligand-binding sensor domain-containing protein/two-component sensor histidine kinase
LSTALALTALLALAAPLAAERLPFRTFTAADGLAGDTVTGITQDAQGYLWVATSSGLSRFGGQQFKSYDTHDGLPSPRVVDVLAAADGTIWVATAGGLARLRPGALAGRQQPVFEAVAMPPLLPGSYVHALFADHRGRVWMAASSLLFSLDPTPEPPVAVPVPIGVDLGTIGSFSESADGSLWLAGERGMVRLLADGRQQHWGLALGGGTAKMVLADAHDRLWIATHVGLLIVARDLAHEEAATTLGANPRPPGYPGELPGRPGDAILYDEPHGLPSVFLSSMTPGRDGIWVATRDGAVQLGGELGGGALRALGAAEGLPDPYLVSAFEDRDGTLWLGSESGGLTSLRRSGWVAYDTRDGLVEGRITDLIDNADGGILVTTRAHDLAVLDGARFTTLTPRTLFRDGVVAGWGWHQFLLRDRRGRIWYPTARGLFRYARPTPLSALREARPEASWTAGHGLPGGDVFRLYEDRRGDVWASLIAVPPLVRFVGGERPEPVPEITGPATGGAPTAFAEDARGGLWVGFYSGGLARYDGQAWRFFGAAEGVPGGFVADLYIDADGRLWVATLAGGAARVDDPTAATPRFTPLSVSDGLTTNSTRCFVADDAGGLFVGTSRGLDRLDLASGRVTSFSTADGLPNSLVLTCHRGPDGRLWFGTANGLARLDARAEAPRRAPALVISGLRVVAGALPVPELGRREVTGLVLEPDQRFLEVDLEALGLDQDRHLAVQHRIGDGAWSTPAPLHTLYFPRLAPGSYDIAVRAVAADGSTGPVPAHLAFRVLPPLWSRGWVRAIGLALLALAAWAAVRLRVARLVAVERARTRIASDLHDDVGAGLSRIALLGEMARRKLATLTDGKPSEVAPLLAEMGRETEELADSAAEIIWSVDPHQDDLGSLVARLRRFAVDLLEARDIRLDFSAPADATAIILAPEVRRAVYLILKEAVHNVAKHSRATRLEIRLVVTAGELVADLRDDGHGIAAGRAQEAAEDGRRGLPGMQRRARDAGGSLSISPAEPGTRLSLRIPLTRGRRRRSHAHAGPDGPSADRTGTP